VREDGSFDAKRRIVGAAILVTAAVVVLPILLQRAPSVVHGREILTVRRAAHGVRAVMAEVPARPAPAAPSATPAPVAGAQAPLAAPPHPTPISPAPPTPPAPAPVVQQWYVQVGAYVNAADGIAFAHRLKGQGFPAHVKLMRLANSRGVIVILGPYGKGRAQGAERAVKQRDGIQGFVIQEAATAR
jgi:cell division septation protein DedD